MEKMVEEFHTVQDTGYKEGVKFLRQQEILSIFPRFIDKKCPIGPVYTTAPSGEFRVAPYTNPSPAGSMTLALLFLTSILDPTKSNESTGMEVTTRLLKRVLKLLQVYYDYQVLKIDSPDLEYCDIPHPANVSYLFSLLGEGLPANSSMLSRLLLIPDFRDLVFSDLPLLPPELEQILTKYHEARLSGRGTMEERKEAMFNTVRCEGYRVWDQWILFTAPIWLWCSIKSNNAPEGLAERALKLHVTATSTFDNYFRYGLTGLSTFTVTAAPDIVNPKLRKAWGRQWIENGGLPSLVQAAMLADNSDMFSLTLHEMTEVDWKCLRLPGVANNVLQLLLYSWDFGSTDNPLKNQSHVLCNNKPAIVRTMYAMFRELGPQIFATGAEQAFRTTKFAYLAKRLACNPEKYKNEDAFVRLYHKHDTLIPAIQRRYAVTLFEPGESILGALDMTGCMSPQCPGRQELLRVENHLENLYHRGGGWEDMDPRHQKAVEGWGRDLKLCRKCRKFAYCSKACQKADWNLNIRHRLACGKY